MNPVRIIVDSTADLTPAVKARLTQVPLTVHFGEEDYIDGVTITHKEFYEKLVECDTLPTTSQATPFAFSEVFQQTLDAGEDAVVITLSSALSGTYQSAVLAAEDFPAQRIHIVDSRSVALGSGILAQYALELADGGMDAAALAEKLTAEREKIHLIALLDTLEYLKRGGRISKTVALAGGLLSIKPVISLDGGEIKLLGSARGSRQGNNLLVQKIRSAGGINFARPVLLGYTGLDDALLQKYIRDSAALWEEHLDALPCTVVGSVVGTHAGPGAIAVAFFESDK